MPGNTHGFDLPPELQKARLDLSGFAPGSIDRGADRAATGVLSWAAHGWASSSSDRAKRAVRSGA
eukprot:15464519-Alexandrium_andersonii.AAC.1